MRMMTIGHLFLGTNATQRLKIDGTTGEVTLTGTIGDRLYLYNSGNNSGTNGIYIDSDIYPAIRFNNRVGFAGTAKIVYNTYATGYGAASLNGSFLMQGPNALQFSSGGDNVRLTITSTGEAIFSSSITSNGDIQINNASGGLRLYTESNGANWFIRTYNAASNQLRFSYNLTGEVASINPTTGVYTALSDKNKKKNLENYIGGLENILQLKPTLYNMISQDDKTAKELGFIAQEVKLIIPEAYTESDDFIGLNYNAFIPVLVNAIKELKAEIDILKNN
jgi:hypothetical protein